MKMRYCGRDKGELKNASVWSVEVIGYNKQHGIRLEIKNSESLIMCRSYRDLKALFRYWCKA